MRSRRFAVLSSIGALASIGFPAALVASSGAAPVPRYAPIFAVLSGGNEIGQDGKANAGDPDGRGAATLVVHGGGKVCFAIVVTRIGKPVAAHVHRAFAGLSGPVVIPLQPPTAGNPGTVAGCVTGVSKALITEMERERGNFYVNVHTADHPDGAVRGQLE